MRLTTVLLIASLLQVSASTFGQRITMNQQNVPLKTLFKEIRKQSGFNFYYDGRVVSPEIRSSIQVSNVSVDEALRVVLAKLPLSYEIKDRLVIITKKATPSFLENVIARFQAIDVRGRVLNEQNQPLAGATVTVKGKNQVTKTDAEGNFYLQNVDNKTTLLISFVGFKPLELGVKEDLGVLILKLEDNSLDQVQVIAYGETSKRFSTSNIGTVTAEEIQRQPVSNPLLTLAGRVPGLFVKQLSGLSSGGVSVNIQGTNSLGNGSEPFYVVDGVPYMFDGSATASLGNVIRAGFGGSPFNFINPSDIESISILKDADATAIYGSRAANGAVLITTKKGTSGKTNINLNVQNGWGKITRKASLVNTQEYLELRKERFYNDGQAIPKIGDSPTSSNYDLTFWDQNKYTDWQDELIGGTASYADIQGSLSGGTANTQFLASYGYHNETYVFPGDFHDRKGNVRFNLNHQSYNKKFKYNLIASFLLGNNTLPRTDISSRVSIIAPNNPDLLLPDGNLNFGYLPNGTTNTFSNPLAVLKGAFTGKTNNLLADNIISYEIINGLNIKATFGFNRMNTDETIFTSFASFRPHLPLANKVLTASYLNRTTTNWITEPQITYVKETNIGAFDAILGSTFQQSKTNLLSQSGTGYPTEAQLSDLNAATTKNVNDVGYDLYNYAAIFGRLNYRLKDKYIVNVNIRRDGSSRFGPENRFHAFYAIGAAWLVGEERIIKTALPWLSFAKLRGSYGTTGNDQITNYRYMSLLDVYGGAQIPYGDGLSLQVNRIDNRLLQWEETRKLNLGLDFGLIKDRITINLTYSRNRSSNQLIGDLLPTITGAAGVDINIPALIQNINYEGQIHLTPIKTEQIVWNLSGNLTIPKNKLLAFPGIENGYSANYIIGQPLGVRQVYPFVGVNSETGLYQYRTVKGELTSAPSFSEDRTRYINVDPKFYGGINNSISYKGFQFDIFCQFVNQVGATQKYINITGAINTVPLKSALDRWRKPGDISQIQKVGSMSDVITARDAIVDSEANYGNISFIRLKNAALSYSIPQSITSRAKMTNARIYVQGQNLLTITNYFGSDPESAASSLPPLKMITFGFQVTF